MNRNIIHILWMAVSLPLLFASCQHEDFPDIPDTDNTIPLSFTVTDRGYTHQISSRASESGYRTDFTAGDECGLYIIRNGVAVYENVKLTATSGPDGNLTWQPEAGVNLRGGLTSEKYFLYYPYQSDMSGKVAVSATDHEDFFSPLAETWHPAQDQSAYAAYTASDLMTAKGEMSANIGGKLSVSFRMSHRMALTVIDVPKTVYKFTDGSIPDYIIGGGVDFSASVAKPYRMTDGIYRYLYSPATKAQTITGLYADGKREFSFTPSGIASGSYKTYIVDGATPIEKQTELRLGDYFCKDADSNWYIIPQELNPDNNVIGIVFYAGQHSGDQSDYSQSGIGQKNCHGYAVALKDATTQTCKWGADMELGCYPSGDNNLSNPDSDWSGYEWTQKIVAAANNTNGLGANDVAGYPASYYAVVEYQKAVSAPVGSSGWFLPSIGQMWSIYQNRNVLFVDTTMSDDLKWAQYNSSSEYSRNPVYSTLILRVNKNDRDCDGKSLNLGFVRAALAF